MQPFSGNQRPDLLTALMNMSLVLHLPWKMHLCRSCSNAPRLPSFLEMPQNPDVLLTFDKVRNPLRLPRKTTSERPLLRTCGAFNILSSKCASRHNSVHFFDIPTSKSSPKLVCFVHVDFEMCFAPQRRALFRHCNFQKWSRAGVFCTFWLGTVLRATTARTFSTAQLPKVLRTWCVLYILTWKCASRHNRVQLFISYLTRWLRTRRFSKPTFQPSGASNHINHSGKTQCFASSYLFAHLHLLSFDFLFSSIYLSTYLSLYLSLSLSLCLPVCLSICLSASLRTKLFCETSSIFEVDNIKHVTCSNSARLPQFLKLTT